MTTTTIRLPEDLKDRVAAAAERAGTTAHNFIVSAIAEKAEQAERAERQAEFHGVAEQRYAAIVASGKAISWNDMRSHLEDRLAGKVCPRPKARKLAR